MSMTDLRKQLLANGYVPIPNVGKACYLTGWPTIEVTGETVEHWGRRFKRFADTGIRVEGGLAVLDLDIDDRETMDEIAAEFEAKKPQLSGALIRFGKGSKEAWFVRTREPFGRIHTRRWLAPGTDVDTASTHVVECFGGASPRQFGAFGAHTREPDGRVAIAYEWEAFGSPLTIPLDQLPELSKADFFELVDIAERVLERRGWIVVQKTKKGESEASRVYDLVEDMVFETSHGEVDVSLAQLRERAGEEGLRVSASWLEPGRQHSLTRCLVGLSHSGDITIWDSATDITHLPADKAPIEAQERQAAASAVAERLQRLAAHQDEQKQRRSTKLTSEDNLALATGKLLRSYALCPTQALQVVPLWAESTGEGMTLTNFRTMMLPWAGVEIGPRGGEKKINPADSWSASEHRVTVAGLRLRPDQPRPTFVEGGKTYVNTYTPVVHPSDGGDPWGGIELLAQLLPDQAERLWFTRWLAYKWRHPAVPGPAVLMVARQFGTGRSTLGELVKQLFGARYVSTVGFDHFAGRTYQAQYTAWQADALVVVVNESSTADNGSQYRTKHDTYERLKEIVDPRAQERTIVTHGKPAFKSMVFASYLIFTNNPDALPLPPEDRRFWVGANGGTREPAFWDGVNAWMHDPANVGAFARWLEEAVDLEGYDPYAVPPMTAGKASMTEMSRSDLDRAFAEALDHLPGELMSPEQIMRTMRKVKEVSAGMEFPDRWEAHARRLIQTQLYRVGVKDGPGWTIMVQGKKWAIYARTQASATRWRHYQEQAPKDDPAFRREVLRNGVDKTPGDLLNKLRLAVDNEANDPGE